ncbi:sulfopyruvate decarboxylase subunit alpha [Methanococcoides sp. NM1]|uniref:sulfopyruvate decarboxylase subunit alpha n=1 Tax=Methanococcoides sp. NM1 TaxID=1201013 RepID=UPI0010823E5F|nr:sulfopyruvate decarboxylase subunit alpha [Methanococcoides sp. NM1]
MDPSTSVFNGMRMTGIDLVVSVPCINLKDILPMIDSDPSMIHVPVTREEEGVGICAGAYMGGKIPAMLMQNSGLGNSINALASLNKLFHIPLLLIVSHRGVEGETICAQVPMGQLTTSLLDALDIPYVVPTIDNVEETILHAWAIASEKGRPVAVLLEIGFWEGE